VHCGQTVERVKVKLRKQVGLGPGHIVLDGDSAPPPPKGHSPNPIFGPYLLRPNGCMDQDATWYRARRLCQTGTPLYLSKKRQSPSLELEQTNNALRLCISIVAKTAACIKMPLGMEVGLSSGDFALDGDPAS